MNSPYGRAVRSKRLNNVQQCCFNSPKFLPAGKGFPHVRFSKRRDAQITTYMKLIGNVPLDSRYCSESHTGKGKQNSRLYAFGITFVTRKLSTRGLKSQKT